MTTYDIRSMDTILLMIGEFLGEPEVDGTRFTRDRKLRWLALASDKLSNILCRDLINVLFDTHLVDIVADTDSYTISSDLSGVSKGTLDSLLAVRFDYEGEGVYRKARKVSYNEFTSIVQAQVDGSVDESAHSSEDYPIYCVHTGTPYTDLAGESSILNKFVLRINPTPDSAITDGIELSFLRMPPTMSYDTTWSSADSLGLALHGKCVYALMCWALKLAMVFDRQDGRSKMWEADFYNEVRELNAAYDTTMTGGHLNVVTPPDLLD